MQQSFDSTTTDDDVFADAEKDDHYGLVRDPNFHDWEYPNRRRRCRFMEASNGNNDGDCSFYLDDPETAVICLRPILPSPRRELSYTPRTGWRYQPRQTPFLDRLGTGIAESNLSVREQKQSGMGTPMPSCTKMKMKMKMKMIIPASFGIRDAEKRKHSGEIIGGKNESCSKSNKRPKLSSDNDSTTVVTNSTAGDNVQNSAPTSFPATAAAVATTTTTTTSGIHSAGKTQTQQTVASTNIVTDFRMGSPKDVLYKWYGKKPRKTQIKAGQYLIWDNGRVVNEKLFSAIFVCPLTKEAFLAGPRFKTDVPDKVGLYWFSRKIMAEHAAAARAGDCLTMRESGGIDSSRGRLCSLEPYWPSQRPRLPIEQIPAKILKHLPPEQDYKNNHAATKIEELRASPNTKTLPRADENTKVDMEDDSVSGQGNKQSNKNFNKRDSTSRNFGRGYRHGQPSQQQQSNHRNDYGNHVRDVQQYRAQRMPYGQHDHYNHQQGMHYQPKQEQQTIPDSNVSYPNYNQCATTPHQIGQYGQHQISHGVPQQQQIPGQNHFGFPQNQQQNQYLPQQPPPVNNHLQYHGGGGVIHNHSNMHNNQRQQIPLPPPPPPRDGSSQNYPTGSWGSQNQHQTNRFQQF